jgi:hypothetical protein
MEYSLPEIFGRKDIGDRLKIYKMETQNDENSHTLLQHVWSC